MTRNSKFPLQPIGGRVVVLPLKEEKKTESGFILPDSGEKPAQGTVVAIDRDGTALKLFTGDRVLFSKYGYETVKLDGIEYYILEEKSILGVLV